MRASNGFTLIELMIVIAIIAVIASFGIPAFNQAIRNNEIRTDTNSLLALLNYARSEAVTRKVIVQVCSSSNGTSCAGDTDWNKQVIALQGATVLRQVPAITTDNTLTASTNTYSFNTDGTATIGTITVCAAPNTVSSRRISINGSGQARSEVFACP